MHGIDSLLHALYLVFEGLAKGWKHGDPGTGTGRDARRGQPVGEQGRDRKGQFTAKARRDVAGDGYDDRGQELRPDLPCEGCGAPSQVCVDASGFRFVEPTCGCSVKADAGMGGL